MMAKESSIIEAKEINLVQLFTNKFFVIPIYQRPLVWSEDNFHDLVEDIKDAIDSGEESYFLGSILLKTHEDKNTYEIIDGQQRLASIVVLLAVFRDHLNEPKIQKWLMQEEDEYAGIPAEERIKVWDDLSEVFSKYIYSYGGTSKFIHEFETNRLKHVDKSSPLYHLYEAIKCFKDFAEGMDKQEIEKFLRYLLTKVYFVRIITSSRSSAFRLFNVLNTRGLPLSAADVLKSMNLEFVSDKERGIYFRKWRELESDLGREEFENIISYVRTIYREEKARRELVDEFETLFKNNIIHKGADFFDIVFKYARIYRDKLVCCELPALKSYEKVRYRTLMTLMKRFLPFSDWVPPLLTFYERFKREDLLYRFALNLERRVFVEWCADFTATERITSAIDLIKLIKRSESAEDVLQMMFKPREIRRGRRRRRIDFLDANVVKEILLSKLDDQQFYKLKGGKLAKYLLLRLDMEMQEENFPGYASMATITVEHILPQTPTGEWLKIFTQEEADQIVNKLGNLTLLNKRRNSRASNYDFKRKKERYFDVKHSVFAITSMLREYGDWNMDSFKRRHRELLDLAFGIYLHNNTL